MTLRLGTRASALALAQSSTVADAIRERTGVQVELVEIATAGDRSSAPIPELGVGVFVSALREALAAKEIDLAVHSYKDLPTAQPDGLVVAAVPVRANPLDALVTRDGRTLAELAAGTRIGTGAPRRVAQLRALRRGLVPVPIRGNVDTRLRKLATGEVDALVLACAGLDRLGRAGEISEVLDPALVMPAPAQGALAVECRSDDPDLVTMLAVLDHPPTRAAVEAERTLLAVLEAGCAAPIAALAEATKGVGGAPEVFLRAAVFSADGAHALRLSRTGTPAQAAQVGRQLAEELLAKGAAGLIAPRLSGAQNETVLGEQR